MDQKLSAAIRVLRKSLDISQHELGLRVGCSAMAVSRWESGQQKCPANILIRLGTLSKAADCWYFWGLAGLTSQDVIRVLPLVRKRLGLAVPVLQVVAAGARKAKIKIPHFVALPLLPLVAAATKEKGSSHFELDSAVAEAFLSAPGEWCPNPSDTICLRVKGDSMEPLLHEGYVVAVDKKQSNVRKAENKIIVAHHKDFGLAVSRLRLLGRTHVLVPDNRSHEPVPLGSEWRMVGTVLWWLGLPQVESPPTR